jgi:hypothetical protein
VSLVKGRTVMTGPLEPPPIRLVVDDREVVGVEGSIVWGQLAIDRLAALPPTVVPVVEGSRVEFALEGDAPREVFLTAYAESAVTDRSLAATRGTALDVDAPAWDVNLPPGRYLLALARTWDDDHSVVHYFAVQIR